MISPCKTCGKCKGYRMPIVVQLVKDRVLTWYAVGDMERVGDYLSGVISIGKKRSYGYGVVESWTLSPWSHDWSEYGPDGVVMRAIPDPEGERDCGIRPPYFYHSVRRRCRVPSRY